MRCGSSNSKIGIVAEGFCLFCILQPLRSRSNSPPTKSARTSVQNATRLSPEATISRIICDYTRARPTSVPCANINAFYKRNSPIISPSTTIKGPFLALNAGGLSTELMTWPDIYPLIIRYRQKMLICAVHTYILHGGI